MKEFGIVQKSEISIWEVRTRRSMNIFSLKTEQRFSSEEVV